jgi:hypothetical protein
MICRGTPTLDEIAAECRKIQATWTPVERERRNQYPARDVELRPISVVRGDSE